MKNSDLFSGIAIVIDDEIGTKNANINNLISQIKRHNMPHKEYWALPNPNIIKHFKLYINKVNIIIIICIPSYPNNKKIHELIGW